MAHRRTAVLSLVVAVVLGVMVAPATAAPITWNLTGSGGSGSIGNTRTFTAGGITVTATAWGYTAGSGNTAFEAAALGQFSTGLGVCNQEEGVGCGNPSHQVDNVGADDWVLFTFSAPVNPLTVRIDPWGYWDRDVSYFVGNVATPLSLAGKTYAQLAGLGFGSRYDDTSGASDSYRDVSILGSASANALLFGAQYPTSDDDDRFKIAWLTAEPAVPDNPVVPEPASMLLLGSGLVGLAGAARRRLKKQ